jgi:hypothetical protein
MVRFHNNKWKSWVWGVCSDWLWTIVFWVVTCVVLDYTSVFTIEEEDKQEISKIWAHHIILLVPCLPYCLTLKMESIYFSKTSNFLWTTCYKPE